MNAHANPLVPLAGSQSSLATVLTEEFGINGSDLVTVGYGKSKPKDPSAPSDPVNRRVQVVNMDTKTASK